MTTPNFVDLENKVAIITGAGRGVGRLISLAYAKQKMRLVLASRTIGEIKKVSNEIQVAGGTSVFKQTDISSINDVQGLIEMTMEEFGQIDVLVNNAAVVGPIGLLENNDINHWINTININLIGTFSLIHQVLPIMKEAGGGKIINLAGGGGLDSRPRFSAYASSKAAIIRLTETIAEEAISSHVYVNAITPGTIYTDATKEIENAGKDAGETAAGEIHLLKQGGGTDPRKIKELAIFLASHSSDRITGKILSAAYDDWQSVNDSMMNLPKDMYNLRRVDRFTFDKVSKVFC
ncbi:MAG: hypothetical protein CBB75_12330 [bacterium TMED15]|nr:MAG: hypothetical protein CBB75_12330 [bacterium TMED15]